MDVLEEYKKQVIKKYFKLVGPSYKVQKRDVYFKVFTRKKYNYWFLDLLEQFIKFFQNDLKSILDRLEKIKGELTRLLVQADQAVHQVEHFFGAH